jgi:hypothetical protein
LGQEALYVVLNRPVDIEESRNYEFKEVKGGESVRSVAWFTDPKLLLRPIEMRNAPHGGNVYTGHQGPSGPMVIVTHSHQS